MVKVTQDVLSQVVENAFKALKPVCLRNNNDQNAFFFFHILLLNMLSSLQTLINQNNCFSYQITGSSLNTIGLVPKNFSTVKSPACLTPSSAASRRPTKGQAHHWLLSLNRRLFHLSISSFLPSFSHSPLFWLIIPPSQKKPPPACRRHFLTVGLQEKRIQMLKSQYLLPCFTRIQHKINEPSGKNRIVKQDITSSGVKSIIS